MNTKSILFSLLAIALAACSNDEDAAIGTGNGRALFSASIEGLNTTRAYDQEWEQEDRIGISGKTGDTSYTNVAYKTVAGDGNFTIATDGTEIYYQDDNTVDFTAYYPWNSLQTGVTAITADTRGQSRQKSFDFLFATGTGSKAAPDVAFPFSHKMAKVVLTIRKGTGVNLTEVKDAALSLEGFSHKGTFSTADGTTVTDDAATGLLRFAHNTDNPDRNAPCAMNEDNETVAYTLILFPQKFSDKLPFYAELAGSQILTAGLDFTEANRNAGDSAPQNEWVAGRQYNMSVTLNKTSITIEGCRISAWEPANGGNVDAE